MDLLIKEMQGSIDKLQNENAKLKTFLSASLAQLEQYKATLKKFVDLNTKLDEDLNRKIQENVTLTNDNSQL